MVSLAPSPRRPSRLTSPCVCAKLSGSRRTMQPRSSAWLAVLVPVLFSCLLYTQSLTGDFTFDDRAAVKENRDVVHVHAPWAQLLRDDFWGGRADLELSHKSYRHVLGAE